MQFLSTFLAWRYLWFKSKDKNISIMIKICFLGILIGTFSLMLTLIITNGFEKVIHEKMQGISSQVIISSPGNRLDYSELQKVILRELKNDIKAVSARILKQALIDRDGNQSVIFLQGIDGPNEANVSTLTQKIVRPLSQEARQIVSDLKDNQIIIGYKTATQYNLHVGNEVSLMIPEPATKHKVFFNKNKFVIVGIFNIGLEEYDNNFAFCQIDYLNKLFNETGADQITIKLHDLKKLWVSKSHEEVVITKLKARFPQLSIQSWKELCPALVSSLKLEKYVMFFILALISLVASMNMISLLFMQIQQKIRDIAIFKAMGMSDKNIRSIFLRLGMSITLSASLLGLGLAALAGYFLEKYPFIELPDVYYVSHLPARMDLEIFLVVFLATVLLGFLATWIPARRSKQIEIAQVLRQE
jgi:lipoprotein-releasing system permease protein